MRILICDDNADAAQTLGALLGSERHEAFICLDGRACIEKALEWKPEVALLDIGMPGMSGYAVAKAMRAEDLGHKVLIIAITGYGSPQDIQLAMDAGFDLHLVKPADPARILRAVSNRKGAHP
jgi:CheY-like chemotaxis protein